MNEGIKETENTRIEKDYENLSEIELLYSFNVVVFDWVLLELKKNSYSIWVDSIGVYDVVIEDKQKEQLIKYEVLKELTPKLKDYFNLMKGEIISDECGNKLKCTSHCIEYKL